MRMGEVIGRVTCSRVHPQIQHARFLLAMPMTREAILSTSADRSESLVVFDELGAGVGSLIGLSEGREAANPFGRQKVPIDAYCACLLDQIHITTA